MKQVLDRFGFDPACDRLFSVGDMIDRGPHSEAAVDWLDEPWFFAVQGNHEDLAVRHVRNGLVDVDNWRRYGGGWFLDLPAARQQALAARYEALPVVIELQTAAGAIGLLHADSPVRDWSRLAGAMRTHRRRSRGRAQWSRDRLAQADASGVANVRAVVAGHTPLSQPVVLGNVYHIDTGGWQEDGYFTLLDLGSLSAWPKPARTTPL
nr:metallophosphoesterase [Bordetella holmesii]